MEWDTWGGEGVEMPPKNNGPRFLSERGPLSLYSSGWKLVF
jgi:hypothetical protein